MTYKRQTSIGYNTTLRLMGPFKTEILFLFYFYFADLGLAKRLMLQQIIITVIQIIIITI